METIIGDVDMDLTGILKTIIPDIPPWTIRTPNINLTFRKFYKNKTRRLIFQEELENVRDIPNIRTSSQMDLNWRK